MEDKIRQGGWLIVLACAMGVSGWSIFWVCRHLGAPRAIAIVAPVCFDTAALMCGQYSMRYLKKGYSGALARFGVLLFGGAAAYVNFLHANLAGERNYLGIIWAVPSVAAVVIYEVHARYEKGTALMKIGKANQPLPNLGALSWLLFFRDTLRAYRAIIAHQRRETLKRLVPEAFLGSEGDSSDTLERVSQTKGLLPETKPEMLETNSVVSMAEIRAWGRRNNYSVGDRGTIDQTVINAFWAARQVSNDE